MKRVCLSVTIIVLMLGLSISIAGAQTTGTPITVENAADLTELAVFGRGTGYELTWSPNSNWLAVGTTIGVWLYDGTDFTAEPVHLPTPLTISALAFSSDGSQLAAIAGTMLYIWDPATFSELHLYELDSPGEIEGMVFSADGSWLALGSKKEFVLIVEVATGVVLATLEGHTDDVMSIALSPDGSLLASGSKDKTVKLWDTADFTEVITLEGHEGNISAMQFSPDGTSLYTGDSKTTIIQWDISGQQLATLKPEKGSYIRSMALTSDGLTLYVAEETNGGIRVWDTESGTELAVYDAHAYREINSFFRNRNLALSSDDSMLATVGSEGTLRIWDATTGENLVTNPLHADEAWSAVFTPDGTQISASYDVGGLRVWDTESLEMVHYQQGVFRIGFTENKISHTYNPDGSQVAVRAAFDIAVYDALTWTKLYEHRVSNHSSVIYSPDGTLLIAVGIPLVVYDAASGEELARLENHTDKIYSVAINEDQTLIVTASEDGTVRLWGIP